MSSFILLYFLLNLIILIDFIKREKEPVTIPVKILLFLVMSLFAIPLLIIWGIVKGLNNPQVTNKLYSFLKVVTKLK